jgi:hypothetical protein
MSLTRVDVLREIAETERDLLAFKKAYDEINRRVLERRELASQDTDDSLSFVEWPGTIAVQNVLIMCIVRLEGILEDYRKNLEALPHGLVSVEDENADQ